MAEQTGQPLEMLRSLRFDPIGQDPLDGRPISIVEQVERACVCTVAVEAARILLALHPDAGGFRLARSACGTDVSVVSRTRSFVEAKTFAGVTPRNSSKIKTMANFLTGSNAHEYLFFHSPEFRGTARQHQFDRGAVQVWSVDIRGRAPN